MGHHPYTNIDGSDPDIATVSHVSSRLFSPCFVSPSLLPSHFPTVCVPIVFLYLLFLIPGHFRLLADQTGATLVSTLPLPAHLLPSSVLFSELSLLTACLASFASLSVAIFDTCSMLTPPSDWDQNSFTRFPDYVHSQAQWVFSLSWVRPITWCGFTCPLLAVVRVNDPSPSQWTMFLTSKLTHCILRFYIPYHFMPLSTLV